MEVFISHITPEAPLAAVLKKWIEDAFLGQVEVFVSSDDDIIPGEEWFHQMKNSLDSAKPCSLFAVKSQYISHGLILKQEQDTSKASQLCLFVIPI